jgi:hypothetical protein
MAFWYLSDNQTLLIDMDDYVRPVKRYMIWGEMFRQRLRDAINAKLLDVDRVITARSNSGEHFHIFIHLRKPMKLMERLCWQLWLASDHRRAASDLMRAARGIAHPSLLIRTEKVAGLWKEPDFTCPCMDGKHTTRKQVALLQAGEGCPVWRRVRGDKAFVEFGPPAHDGRERPMNLPIGEVPLEEILIVGEVKNEEEGEEF